jgi:acyl carrier protein
MIYGHRRAVPVGPDWSRYVDVLRAHLPALDPANGIEPTAPLRDMGLTSIRAVDLLIDLEDQFAFAFPDEVLTAETFTTAASLWDVVGDLIERRGEEER